MTSKLQPQAPEMEQAVIGAMMLEKECCTQVADILSADDFYAEPNRFIYEAMMNLLARHEPVDMLTVTQELKRTGKLDAAGGPWYVSQLTSQVASSAHTTHHALIVKQKAHARRLIRLMTHFADKAYDETTDIYELQEQFEKEFTALMSGSGTAQSQELSEVLKECIEWAAHKQELKDSGQATAIPTGIEKLDKAFDGGLFPTDLTVLGARPSMGKTQIALWFAKAAASAGKHTAFVSGEMAAIQLGSRFILEDERIIPSHYRGGEMTPEEWKAVDESAARLWHLPIYIAADSTIRNLRNIRSLARRLKRQGKLDQLIIDYLGLLQAGVKFDLRYQQVGYITGELKNLAKELEISIILLSQLSRPQKAVRDRVPTLEDLRESGDIEQDADRVIFLHKPGFNDPDYEDMEGNSWKNKGQLIVAKNREGQRGITIVYHHDDRYKKIF